MLRAPHAQRPAVDWLFSLPVIVGRCAERSRLMELSTNSGSLFRDGAVCRLGSLILMGAIGVDDSLRVDGAILAYGFTPNRGGAVHLDGSPVGEGAIGYSGSLCSFGAGITGGSLSCCGAVSDGGSLCLGGAIYLNGSLRIDDAILASGSLRTWRYYPPGWFAHSLGYYHPCGAHSQHVILSILWIHC